MIWEADVLLILPPRLVLYRYINTGCVLLCTYINTGSILLCTYINTGGVLLCTYINIGGSLFRPHTNTGTNLCCVHNHPMHPHSVLTVHERWPRFNAHAGDCIAQAPSLTTLGSSSISSILAVSWPPECERRWMCTESTSPT